MGVKGPGASGSRAPLIKGVSKEVLKDVGLWTEDATGVKKPGKFGALLDIVADSSTS